MNSKYVSESGSWKSHANGYAADLYWRSRRGWTNFRIQKHSSSGLDWLNVPFLRFVSVHFSETALKSNLFLISGDYMAYFAPYFRIIVLRLFSLASSV